MLVLFAEDFASDPAREYARVLDFLGLAPHRPTFERHNVGHYPQMLPETREALRKRFEEPNAALERLLGRPLPWRPQPGHSPPGEGFELR